MVNKRNMDYRSIISAGPAFKTNKLIRAITLVDFTDL